MYCTIVPFALAVLVLSAPPASATDIPVSPGQSIQAAIDSAVAGDNVLVQPGTYFEAIDFKGKAITVKGVGGPLVTTIDATGIASSVVKFVTTEPVATTLDGFTITHGSGQLSPGPLAVFGGGGIACWNGAKPTIRHCRIVANAAVSGSLVTHGGGVFSDDASTPTLTHCRIANNSATDGGGVSGKSVVLRFCSIVDNTASEDGGGVWLQNVDMQDCRVAGNVAANDGGGAWTFVEFQSPSFDRCTFAQNVAGFGGGGVFASGFIASNVNRCAFFENSAGVGGAVFFSFVSDSFLFGPAGAMTSCVLANNAAALGGGVAMSATGNVPGALTLTNCSIVGHANGSGVFASGSPSIFVLEPVNESVSRARFD